ncbi:Dynein alpha chain, flagellar outer arm [Symbiodinium microadriaticum]|uniref:Dynein alpha chain, flagellar outer arm n=1 Tax=Symbiodinium microadriaticum TaxID=2951 RepID=A0A1Q9D6B1_SYMMI|nr:Dynein alpha chain, flagellar outer arm [Symbiodinium microadriaticum]
MPGLPLHHCTPPAVQPSLRNEEANLKKRGAPAQVSQHQCADWLGADRYGGMDGRRNDQGKSVTDTKARSGGTALGGGDRPRVAAAASANAISISQDEVFLFGGIHSTTPYQVQLPECRKALAVAQSFRCTPRPKQVRGLEAVDTKMVDISLQAVDGDSLPKDLFLSLRVGEQQKFSKANCSRTYKFPSSADRRYGKLELYRRVGVSSVSLDGESFQGAHEMAIQVEESCSVSGKDERIPNKEVKYRLCLGGSASLPSPTNEAAKAQPDPAKQTSTKETKVVQAREYLQQHQLEQRLSEAMQAVLRERPEDPAAFIAQKLQSKAGVLKKVEEPVSVPVTAPEPPKLEPKAQPPAKQEHEAAAPAAAAPASTSAPAAPVPAPAPAEPKAAKAPVEAPKAQAKEPAAPAPTPKPAAAAPTPKPAAPAAAPAAAPVAAKPLAQPEVRVNLAMPSLADYPLPDNNFAVRPSCEACHLNTMFLLQRRRGELELELMELGYCCRGCNANGCCTRDCENQPFVAASESPSPAAVLEVSNELSSRQQEPLKAHTNSQSNNANIEMKVFGFMDTASPLGPTWEKACQGRAPTVNASTGMLMGKWAECLAWAVAYEAQHPDWTSTGDVIEVLNDGWIMDTTCYEWKHVQFKAQSQELKGSYWKRMCGKILEHPYVAAQAELLVTRLSAVAQTARSAVSGLNFENIVMFERIVVRGCNSKVAHVSMTLLLAGCGWLCDEPWRILAAFFRATTGGEHFKRQDPPVFQMLRQIPSALQVSLLACSKRVSHAQSYPWLLLVPGARKSWKKFLSKQMTSMSARRHCVMQELHKIPNLAPSRQVQRRLWPKEDRTGMAEEEQFHEDLLAMVSSCAQGEVRPQLAKGLERPRANHTTCIYENTVGSVVWTLNLDSFRLASMCWAELTCHGNPPAPRSGHASFQKAEQTSAKILGDEFAKDGFVFVFGGWNGESQFNDLFMLDVENKVASLMVLIAQAEAIPSWRVFVFGGSADRMGRAPEPVCVLDLGDDRKWLTPVPEESRLIMYGGWANKWLDDCWQINVASIVGYAIVQVDPPLGPVKISGIGFLSVPGAAVVRFSAVTDPAGGRFSVEAQGQLLGCLQLRLCVEPVQVADYHYFLNTIPDMQSLCYGPGLLVDQQAEATFMIQARNQLGENSSLSQNVGEVIQINHVYINDKGKESLRELPHEVIDFDNGQSERAQLACYNTAVALAYAGQATKLSEDDVKGLIKVMNHIKDMYQKESELLRQQDCIYETLAHIEREGVPVEKQLKSLKKVSANLAQLKVVCQSTETAAVSAIQPLVQIQSEIYKSGTWKGAMWTRIAEFEQALRSYHTGLKKVTEYLDLKTSELQDLQLIAKNFEYPDEVKESFRVMGMMREDDDSERAATYAEAGATEMATVDLASDYPRLLGVDGAREEQRSAAYFWNEEIMELHREAMQSDHPGQHLRPTAAIDIARGPQLSRLLPFAVGVPRELTLRYWHCSTDGSSSWLDPFAEAARERTVRSSLMSKLLAPFAAICDGEQHAQGDAKTIACFDSEKIVKAVAAAAYQARPLLEPTRRRSKPFRARAGCIFIEEIFFEGVGQRMRTESFRFVQMLLILPVILSASRLRLYKLRAVAGFAKCVSSPLPDRRKWRELATQLLLATSRSVGGAAEIGIGLMRLAENLGLGNIVVFAVRGQALQSSGAAEKGLLQKPLSLKRRGESTLRQSFRGVNQVSTLLLRACALLPAPIYRRQSQPFTEEEREHRKPLPKKPQSSNLETPTEDKVNEPLAETFRRLKGLELLLGCSAGRANDIYTATDSAVSCTAETPDRAVSSKCNRMQERDKVAGGLAKEAPSSGKERLDSTAAAAYTGVALERFSQTDSGYLPSGMAMEEKLCRGRAAVDSVSPQKERPQGATSRQQMVSAKALLTAQPEAVFSGPSPPLPAGHSRFSSNSKGFLEGRIDLAATLRLEDMDDEAGRLTWNAYAETTAGPCCLDIRGHQHLASTIRLEDLEDARSGDKAFQPRFFEGRRVARRGHGGGSELPSKPRHAAELFSRLVDASQDVALIKALWDHEVERIRLTESYLVKRWGTVDALQMEDDVKANFKKLKEYKVDKKVDVYVGMQEVIKRWVIFCPLVGELSDPSMRPRHWSALVTLCDKQLEVSKELLLRDMWNMELHKFPTEALGGTSGLHLQWPLLCSPRLCASSRKSLGLKGHSCRAAQTEATTLRADTRSPLHDAA